MAKLSSYTIESAYIRGYLEDHPNAGYRPVAKYLRAKGVHLQDATINKLTQQQRGALLQEKSMEVGNKRVIRSTGEVIQPRYEHLANPRATQRARVGTITDTHGGTYDGTGYRVYAAGDVTNSDRMARFYNQSNNSESYGVFVRVVSSNGTVVQTPTVLAIDPSTHKPLDWDKIFSVLMEYVQKLEDGYSAALLGDGEQLSYEIGFVGVEL